MMKLFFLFPPYSGAVITRSSSYSLHADPRFNYVIN